MFTLDCDDEMRCQGRPLRTHTLSSGSYCISYRILLSHLSSQVIVAIYPSAPGLLESSQDNYILTWTNLDTKKTTLSRADAPAVHSHLAPAPIALPVRSPMSLRTKFSAKMPHIRCPACPRLPYKSTFSTLGLAVVLLSTPYTRTSCSMPSDSVNSTAILSGVLAGVAFLIGLIVVIVIAKRRISDNARPPTYRTGFPFQQRRPIHVRPDAFSCWLLIDDSLEPDA